MTQTEMIEELAIITGLSKYRLRKVLKSMSSLMIKILANGDRVTIAQIGKLSVIDTKGRMGHNPKTGEALYIPANKRVKFEVSKVVRKIIRI